MEKQRPSVGNLPKLFGHAVPNLGMLHRSAGKVSQTWEWFKTVRTGFPKQGKGSKQCRWNFPNAGTVFFTKKS